jgi:hypothetical protein
MVFDGNESMSREGGKVFSGVGWWIGRRCYGLGGTDYHIHVYIESLA